MSSYKSMINTAFIIGMVTTMSQDGDFASNPGDGNGINTMSIPLYTPDIMLQTGDVKVCVATEVPDGEDLFITEFHPHPSRASHNMVTYACEQPGFLNPDGSPGAWECGADYNHRHEGLVHAPSCNGTFRPIHFVGSPEEGQDLVLPSGFGFEVGGSTPFKYIVIEAHFTVMGELFDHNRTGTAGTTFTAVQQRDHLLKNAGYLPAKAYGRLEPNAVSTVHGYYPINEPMNMHPIALASHTHDLGIGVSIYKVARDGERTLMFHQDPRKDKQFRPPLQQNLTLTTGDAIAFSCAYNNTSPEWIDVFHREMCFADIFYYDNDGRVLPFKDEDSTDPAYLPILKQEVAKA